MTKQVNLIHCSYHKCLTVYYKRVMRRLYNNRLRTTIGQRGVYMHLKSDIDQFYDAFERYRIVSVNNHPGC